MHTQTSPLMTAVQSNCTRTCETLFHELFVVACMIAMWLVMGSLNVHGQVHEILSPGINISQMELSEPTVSEYSGNGYFIEEAMRSSAPHRIIQSPAPNPLRNTPSQYSHSPNGPTDGHSSRSAHASQSTVKQVFDETLHTDGPLLRRFHEHKQSQQAKIPDATVEPQWKVPYAYGYFGASGKKHWTKSSGYRDTYKRWTKE